MPLMHEWQPKAGEWPTGETYDLSKVEVIILEGWCAGFVPPMKKAVSSGNYPDRDEWQREVAPCVAEHMSKIYSELVDCWFVIEI